MPPSEAAFSTCSIREYREKRKFPQDGGTCGPFLWKAATLATLPRTRPVCPHAGRAVRNTPEGTGIFPRAVSPAQTSQSGSSASWLEEILPGFLQPSFSVTSFTSFSRALVGDCTAPSRNPFGSKDVF